MDNNNLKEDLNCVKVLEKLISFNTVKDKENKEIISYLEEYLSKYDFRVVKKDKYLIMESNFGKEDEYGVCFVGHTDTVEAVGDWKYDPFKLIIDGDKLYGLGTCDMKGGIAAFLDAVRSLDKSKISKKIKAYFTYDEEIGFTGIKDVLEFEKNINKNGDDNNFIIGEPTNNEILLGSKGLIEYKVTFKGIKVHSSVPEKGKSAIFDCVKFIEELKEFYEKEIREELDEAFSIPYTTFNVGIINGGSEINSVAEKCEILFDFRTINKNENKIVEFTNKLIEKYNAEKEILNNIPAFLNKSEFTDEVKTCSFITEASFLNGNRIILGPGPVNPHEKNEYITIDSLERCVKQYEEIINKLCK